MDTITSKTIHDYSEYIEFLLKTEKSDEEFLRKLYTYTKSISDFFYDGKSYTYPYACILTPLMMEEGKINSKIIDTYIDFVYQDVFKTPDEFDNFMDYLVFETRKYLVYRLYGYQNGIKYDDVYLHNRSKFLVNQVMNICHNNNVKVELLTLVPGFDKDAHLFDIKEPDYHYAFIITYDNNEYLMDTTFSQFFYTRNNILDKLGIMKLGTCDPGCFMLMSETGKNMISELIKNGYVKLDAEKKKTYLDAFTMSYRNGLYYENTNDFSFEPSYTLDDYDKLLHGDMSQVDIEGLENLGYQTRPLKDYQMVIKKK